MLDGLRELKLAGASVNTNNPNRLTLSGTIPTTLGTLSNLRVLELTGSSYLEYEGGQYCYGCSYEQFFVGLTGTIPNQLGNLSNLRVLKLNSNELTGTIPATLGNLIQMERLNLSYNDLTGTIPSNLNGNQDWRDSNLSKSCDKKSGLCLNLEQTVLPCPVAVKNYQTQGLVLTTQSLVLTQYLAVTVAVKTQISVDD